MPFQKGNKLGVNNGKTWHWRQTIERAIAQDDGKLMRRAADKLLRLAAAGDIAAIKELGDRLDGKAHQSVGLTDPDGESVPSIRVIFVTPGGDDGK